jgi:hypothetical protein
MHSESRNMTDGERVVHTANLLEISELEVFRRGYLQWFGTEPEPAALEDEFVRYLYFGETPMWVRHYTRGCLGSAANALPRGRRAGVLGALRAWLTETRLVRFLTQ